MVITECSEDRFEFGDGGGSARKVVAEFSGGTISSDGGGLLLRETDTKMNLLGRFSQCFVDGRDPLQTERGTDGEAASLRLGAWL